MSTHHVFCYGSLMYPQVWQRVVDGRYERQHATVRGYQRYALRHASYPGLRPALGAAVAGVLYLDVGARDLHQLDAFEGEEYERIAVARDGATYTASAYLYRDAFAHRVLETVWDAAFFEAYHLPRFLTR
ncbi:MAG: gamma-glutamylcyclotransferase family protein [Bacteroidota bacterium]